MKKLGGIALVLGILVLSAPTALSQGPGGRGFGGPSPLMLLNQKSVQEELKLTEEQTKKITELSEKSRESMKGLSREERKTKGEEIAKENSKAVAGILNADQNKRLKQIVLQQRGSRAIADPEVAEALKLTDEQKTKIKDIQEEAGKQVRELFQGGGDREEGRKKMEELRKSTNEKVQGVLTAEQKTKLKEMSGEPFKGEIKFERRGPGGKKKNEL